MHRIMDRVSMFRSFQVGAAFWLSLTCFFFIWWGLLSRWTGCFLCTCCFEFCFSWPLLAGVRKYLRNHCPLAAKFGTWLANLLKGSALHVWVIVLGGILCIFLLSDAVFLCYRDIVSVTKLTYSFQSVAGGAGSYAAFSHTLTWVEK